MSKPKTIKGVTCKNGYYYARIDGEQKYCGKGEKGFKLAKTARMKWEVKQYENKEINAGLKVKRTEFKTVQDISNWYMTLPVVQEKKSYGRYVIACSHLLKYFGRNSISGIEPDRQEQYRAHRKNNGAADATINFEISILRAIYKMALKRKKIPIEAMPGEFLEVGFSVPRRIVTEKEFEKLLFHSDSDFQDLITSAYETAMRLSEIINLTSGQVHLDIRHISGAVLDYIDLGIFDTKNGTRRTIPVCGRLKEILKRRIKNIGMDEYVFTNKGQKYYGMMIANRLRSACKNAGIIYGDKPVNKKGERIGIVFHCFRHTRTSKWVEMGFSDEVVRRATGHKSLEAYQRYVKLGPQSVMMLVENPKRDKNGIKSASSL